MIPILSNHVKLFSNGELIFPGANKGVTMKKKRTIKYKWLLAMNSNETTPTCLQER